LYGGRVEQCTSNWHQEFETRYSQDYKIATTHLGDYVCKETRIAFVKFLLDQTNKLSTVITEKALEVL